jgi:Lrp/AsnC family transcriptional regulator for asnA, asnC and gidA
MIRKLSDVQREILGILTVSGGITVEELAKRLGLKSHLVRYQTRALLESKRVNQAVLINHRALGYQPFNIFFDFPRDREERALSFLTSRPEVAWLCLNMGPRKFEATIIVRDYVELAALFRKLGDTVDVHLDSPIIAIEGEVRHWGLRFLTGRPTTQPCFTFSIPEEFHEADEIDKKILQSLRKGSNGAMPTLARTLGLPLSTVKYRLDRLRQREVLSPDIFFAENLRDFVQLQMVLRMRTRSRASDDLLLQLCEHNPHVEYVIAGVGNWDYKVNIQAESMRDLMDIQQRFLSQISRIVASSSTYVRDSILWVGPGLPWSRSAQESRLWWR